MLTKTEGSTKAKALDRNCTTADLPDTAADWDEPTPTGARGDGLVVQSRPDHDVGVIALGGEGGNLVNPTFTFTCADFTLTADSASYTIDNTGTGDQSVTVRVVDGYGTELVAITDSDSVGSSASSINITYIFNPAPAANPITATISSSAGGVLPVDTVWYTASGSCPGLSWASPEEQPEPPFGFTDGCMNNRDIAAPFAIYPTQDGLQIYWINVDSTGSLALSLTRAELDAVPADPAQNTLIASNATYSLALYRLMDGKLQAQAFTAEGKLYVFILPDLG
jgi:hypothetical protein